MTTQLALTAIAALTLVRLQMINPLLTRVTRLSTQVPHRVADGDVETALVDWMTLQRQRASFKVLSTPPIISR